MYMYMYLIKMLDFSAVNVFIMWNRIFTEMQQVCSGLWETLLKHTNASIEVSDNDEEVKSQVHSWEHLSVSQ